jgi:hypothetical protein
MVNQIRKGKLVAMSFECILEKPNKQYIGGGIRS